MPKRSERLPDASEFSRAAGIPLPADFVKLIDLAISRYPRDPGALTDGCMGIRLAGPWEGALTGSPAASHDIRYPQTPPELVPFGTMNVDGVHYGFIARTPELPADDYVAGEFCSMDGDAVSFLGATFREAIETLASQHLSYLPDDDEELSDAAAADLAEISRELAISPSPKKAGRQFTRDGDARPLPAPKAAGYLFQKTLDGVGVLAPRSAFATTKARTVPDDLSTGIKAAAKSLKAGFPASALAILKDLWWMHSHTLEAMNRLAPLTAESYEALSRPAFASVVRYKVARAEASAERRRNR